MKELILQAARELGVEIKFEVAELAQYVRVRAAHLAKAVGEPGFELALVAERDSCAMMAGITAVDSAEKFDQRVLGIIETALAFGAKVLL